MQENVLLIVVLLALIEIRLQLFKLQRVNTAKGHKHDVLMDSSALIDGRVVDIAKAGFLQGTLVISKSVLDELQRIADGRDTQKRDRARFGLDVVHELQQQKSANVYVDHDKQKELGTDDHLVHLAKKRGYTLCTTDYNLNKVAIAEGVAVLNVNELAQAIRTVALPGDELVVKIIQKGEAPGQGVGYLEDGTMAVVNNAAHLKGKSVAVTVDRMIQTKAGKMLFGQAKTTKK